MAREPKARGTDNARAFPRRNGRSRQTRFAAPPAPDLDEDKGFSLFGHEIEFGVPKPDVPVEDGEALLREKEGSDLLAPPPGLQLPAVRRPCGTAFPPARDAESLQPPLPAARVLVHEPVG